MFIFIFQFKTVNPAGLALVVSEQPNPDDSCAFSRQNSISACKKLENDKQQKSSSYFIRPVPGSKARSLKPSILLACGLPGMKV